MCACLLNNKSEQFIIERGCFWARLPSPPVTVAFIIVAFFIVAFFIDNLITVQGAFVFESPSSSQAHAIKYIWIPDPVFCMNTAVFCMSTEHCHDHFVSCKTQVGDALCSFPGSSRPLQQAVGNFLARPLREKPIVDKLSKLSIPVLPPLSHGDRAHLLLFNRIQS